MRAQIIIPLIVILTLGGVTYHIWGSFDDQEVQKDIFVQPSKGVVEDFLLLKGQVEADRSIEILSPKVRGYYKLIVEKRIEEGTRVKKGDTIVSFDTSELEKDLSALEDQEMVKKIAEEKRMLDHEININNIKASIANQALVVKKSKLKVTRDKSIPKKERQRRRINYQQEKITLKKLKNKLKHQLAQNKKELEMYRLKQGKLTKDIANIKEGLAKYSIKAPSDGLIIHPRINLSGQRGKIKAGTSVLDGVSVIKIPDLQTLVAVVYVNEIDVLKVKPDLPVEIALNINSGVSIPGEIKSISVLPSTRKERENLYSNDPAYLIKEFKIKIAFKELTPDIIPGMGLMVKVKIAHKDDVLRVPIASVIEKDGGFYVLQKADKQNRVWRKIIPGLLGVSHLEVLSGLGEKDLFLLNLKMEKYNQLGDNG